MKGIYYAFFSGTSIRNIQVFAFEWSKSLIFEQNLYALNLLIFLV